MIIHLCMCVCVMLIDTVVNMYTQLYMLTKTIDKMHYYSIRVVSTMIDHDPEYTMLRGQFESIPLHNASLHGHCNVVKVLLNEHTSTSHSNQLKAMTGKSKQTPLHLAALYGHVKVVEFLLGVCSRLKIELNTLRNKFNGTPVHVAAYKGRTQ